MHCVSLLFAAWVLLQALHVVGFWVSLGKPRPLGTPHEWAALEHMSEWSSRAVTHQYLGVQFSGVQERRVFDSGGTHFIAISISFESGLVIYALVMLGVTCIIATLLHHRKWIMGTRVVKC